MPQWHEYDNIWQHGNRYDARARSSAYLESRNGNGMCVFTVQRDTPCKRPLRYHAYCYMMFYNHSTMLSKCEMHPAGRRSTIQKKEIKLISQNKLVPSLSLSRVSPRLRCTRWKNDFFCRWDGSRDKSPSDKFRESFDSFVSVYCAPIRINGFEELR